MARRFNIEVAIAMLGESVKKIEAEFKRVGESAVRELEKIRKSAGSLDSQVKDIRKNVKGAVGAFLLFDGAVKAIETLDRHYDLLNDSQRQLVGNLGDMSKALRSFDLPGFAAALGQALGNATNMYGDALGRLRGELSETDRGLEQQRNLANILAKEGYDVVGKSLEQLQAIMDGMVGRRRDLVGEIFGDPSGVREAGERFARDLEASLGQGEGVSGGKRLETVQAGIRKFVDDLEKHGERVGPELQRWATGFSVLSTSAIEAEKKAGAAAKALADKQASAAKAAADAARAAGKAWGEHIDQQEVAARSADWAQMIQHAKQFEDQLESLLQVERDRANAAASYKAAREAAGFIDLGKLREEVAWEEKRLTAQLKGKDALIAWTAAKESADYAARTGATAQMVAEYEALIVKLETARQKTDEVAEANRQFSENMWRGVQSSLSGAIAAGFRDGEDAMEQFGDALVDLVIDSVAQWLAAVIAAQLKAFAARMAQIQAQNAAEAAGGKGGGGGFNWSSLAGMFGGGGGTAATGGATSPIAGMNYTGGTMSTASSGTSAAGASSGIWAAAAAAAVVVAFAAWRKHERDQASKVRYGTTATLMEGQSGNISGYWLGKLNKTGQLAVDGLKALFTDLSSTLGTGLSGMEQVTIKIRNDKKGFEAYVGQELVGRFASLEQATIAAAKKVFTSGELGSQLDAFMASIIGNFNSAAAADPEGLAKAVAAVQGVRDVFLGISAQERTILQARAAIEAFTRSLIDMGVQANQAREVGMMNAVNSFRDLWTQLSGKQMTPQEQGEQQERARKLLILQITLYAAELKAKQANLQSSIRILQMELGVDRQDILAQAKLFEAEVDIMNGEIMAGKQYLRNRAQLAGMNVDLMNAELIAIGAILEELDKLIAEVTVGPISRGGVGRGGGRGGGMGVGNDGGRFWDMLLGDDSALSPEQQMAAARQRYDQLKARAATGGPEAKAAFEEFSQRFIEEARGFYGSTAPFADLFEMVSRDLARFGEGSNQERAARQAAIREIYDLAEAAGLAAAVFDALGGGRPRRRRGGGNAGAANSNTSASSAVSAGYGDPSGLLAGLMGEVGGIGSSASALAAASSGGSSAIVRELRASSSKAAEQAERAVASAERQGRRARRQRRGRGGVVDSGGGAGDVPPPPPPPVYSGNGAGGPRVRLSPDLLVS